MLDIKLELVSGEVIRFETAWDDSDCDSFIRMTCVDGAKDVTQIDMTDLDLMRLIQHLNLCRKDIKSGGGGTVVELTRR